jgi:Tol biopolymer transport system component
MRIGERYRIERLLGEGGMGAVFLAYDEMLQTDVALKFVFATAADDQALRRLRAEVLLAQRVTHRNVCRTYDLEELDGALVVKMEYVQGETLARRFEELSQPDRKDPSAPALLPIEEVLEIARGVAAGLEAAHARGVVHCDLKPHNIMREHGTGRVVLMDFGISRITAERETGNRSMWGTPEYMAPEQARGLPVEPRTDLYSLGCVLYHMVTGEPPYRGKTPLSLALRHINDPAPDPRARRPDLPEWLAQVIRRLMAKPPQARFPSATEVLIALQGPPRRDRRRTLLVGLRALGLGLGLSIGGMVLLLMVRHLIHRPHGEWRPDIRDRLPTYDENADDLAISPDGRTLAYISDREGFWRLYVEPLDGGPARALTSRGHNLPHARWTRDSQALVGVMSSRRAARIRIDGSPPEVLADRVLEVEDCGGQLVLARRGIPDCDDCIRVVRYAGPEEKNDSELFRLPPGLVLKWLRCDREGRYLAYTVALPAPSLVLLSTDLYVFDLKAGTQRQLTFDHQQNGYPTFAPDGQTIVFSSTRGGPAQLWEIPVTGGTPVLIPTPGQARGPSITPDGQHLLYHNDVTALQLFAHDLETGGKRRITSVVGSLFQPHPTPDGREILVRIEREGKSQAALVTLDPSEERLLTPANAVTLTPAGDEVIYAINGAAASEVWAMPRAGGPARRLTQLLGPVHNLHADTEWVYASIRAGDHRGAWRIPLAGGPALREGTPGVLEVFPAPKGGWRLLGLVQPTGQLELRWRAVAPDRPLDDPLALELLSEHVAWAPDGDSFLVWTHNEIRRYWVDGEPSEVVVGGLPVNGGMALSSNGETLYTSELVGHAYRQVITNFAARPRPPH